MACCHIYQAGLDCDCRDPWKDEEEMPHPKVGEFVRIRATASNHPLPFEVEYGVVVQASPEKGGCLVRSVDSNGLRPTLFGWAWDEMEVVMGIPTSRFDRELEV